MLSDITLAWCIDSSGAVKLLQQAVCMLCVVSYAALEWIVDSHKDAGPGYAKQQAACGIEHSFASTLLMLQCVIPVHLK